MHAIVEVASRQHKVKEGDTLDIPQVKKKKEVSLDKVLMTIAGKDINIGTPYLKGAKVICDVIGDVKGKKVISFKFKRRKSYQKTIGHRDTFTKIKVKEIKVA